LHPSCTQLRSGPTAQSLRRRARLPAIGFSLMPRPRPPPNDRGVKLAAAAALLPSALHPLALVRRHSSALVVPIVQDKAIWLRRGVRPTRIDEARQLRLLRDGRAQVLRARLGEFGGLRRRSNTSRRRAWRRLH
jgi:hypothetical protein